MMFTRVVAWTWVTSVLGLFPKLQYHHNSEQHLLKTTGMHYCATNFQKFLEETPSEPHSRRRPPLTATPRDLHLMLWWQISGWPLSRVQTMWNSLTIPWRFAALLPMLSVSHIMPVLMLLSVVRVGMQHSAWSKTKMKCTNSVKNVRKYSANNKQVLGHFSLTRFFYWHFPDF